MKSQLNGNVSLETKEPIQLVPGELTGPNWPQAAEKRVNGNPEDDAKAALLKKALVGQSEIIEPPPVVISFAGESGESIVATLGNFSVITGKAKSKKTFFVIALVAALLSGKNILDVIRGILPEKKKTVLVFDTEQARFHTQRMQKRILRLAGLHSCEHLYCFSLRSLSATERLETIDYALRTIPNIGVVVIDGIRDLQPDPIMDSVQAEVIISALLRWTEQRNIHIITVLHQNKGDTNVRGFLGTEAVNKAETTLSITRNQDNKEISIVQPEYLRDKEFEPLGFSIDDNGLPALANGWELQREKYNTQKGITPKEITPITHKEILDKVFGNNPKPKYSELVSQIKLAIEGLGKKIGDNKIRDFITHYENQGWILKAGVPKTKSAHYVIGSFLPASTVLSSNTVDCNELC